MVDLELRLLLLLRLKLYVVRIFRTLGFDF